MTEPATHPSTPEPTGYRRWSEEWWKNRGPEVKERRCTGHKRSGEQCRNPAILGTTVCGYHGGRAPQVKKAARLRLEMAADRMARQLLGIADSGQSEAVRLAAIKDALDRSGIQAKTAVSVEVSSKPFELVFDSIAAGPRDPAAPALAIEGGIVDEDTDSHVSESVNDEVIGEIDDDELDDDLPRIRRDSESESAEIVDVEVVAGYTDDGSGTTTPDQDQSQPEGHTAPIVGPLGPNGPVGSGLMSITEANEAAAFMRQREAARIRDMRRR